MQNRIKTLYYLVGSEACNFDYVDCFVDCFLLKSATNLGPTYSLTTRRYDYRYLLSVPTFSNTHVYV